MEGRCRPHWAVRHVLRLRVRVEPTASPQRMERSDEHERSAYLDVRGH